MYVAIMDGFNFYMYGEYTKPPRDAKNYKPMIFSMWCDFHNRNFHRISDSIWLFSLLNAFLKSYQNKGLENYFTIQKF